MVVKRQKIAIEVEMTTEGAARNAAKLGKEWSKASKEAGELAEAGGDAAREIRKQEAAAKSAAREFEKLARSEARAAKQALQLAASQARAEVALARVAVAAAAAEAKKADAAAKAATRVAAAESKKRKAAAASEAEFVKSAVEAGAAADLKREAAAADIAAKKLKVLASVDAEAARQAENLAKKTTKASRAISGMKSIVAEVSSRIRIDAVGAFELAARSISSVARAVPELANESLKVQGVFNTLPFSIAPAAKATEGLADNMTLATQAIMANRSGVATSAKEFANLTSIAQKLALGSGRDVAETIERITQGLAKQERELLDELVVIPRMDDIFRKLAERLGKTSTELTDQEKNAEFNRVALEALSAAADGTNVSTDGMAGSIVRARVELENLRTTALGGGDATITLREGIRLLDADLTLNATTIRENLGAEFELKDALAELGVTTDDLRVSTEELAGAVEDGQKIEGKRLANLAEDNELTSEQLEQGKRLIDQQTILSEFGEEIIRRDGIRIANEEFLQALAEQDTLIRQGLAEQALIDAENALAFARGAQLEQGTINDLVAEEAEAKIRLLELEGKLEEAAKARRKAELGALTALGGSGVVRGRGRGGGGAAKKRRDKEAKEERDRLKRNNQIALEQFQVINNLQFERFKIDQETNPFSEQNMQLQLTNVIDFEAERAEVVFNARQREIEALKAAGLDPVEAAQLQADASLALLTEQQAAEERRFEREIQLAEFEGREFDAKMLRSEQEIAQLQFQDDIEAEQHAVAMVRIEEKAAIEEEAAKRKARLLGIASDALARGAQAAALAAFTEGASIRQAVANTAKGIAKEHGLIALSEFAKATVAGLSGNAPGAAAHAAAGAQSLAVAAAAGAVGGALGGVGSTGGGRGLGGFGAEAFGPGRGDESPAAPSQGTSGDIGGPVPLSPTQRQTVSQQAAQASTGGGGNVINITQNVTSMGKPDEESMRLLAQAGDLAVRKVGKLSRG